MFSIFLCLAVLFETNCQQFSGLYIPNTKNTSEDFGAAWLISRSRLIATEPLYDTTGEVSMAAVSLVTVRNRCKNCHTLLTRDYFDFLVEHLSASTNNLPNSNKYLFRALSRRMSTTAQGLKKIAMRSVVTEQRLNETIGVLVYSSNAYSQSSTKAKVLTHHKSIRKYFFESTFWSIYRHIKHIVVYVASDRDREDIYAMKLPFWSIQQLTVPVKERLQNKTILLPRMSVQTTIGFFLSEEHPEWQDFKYVYWTEGDQILHMRSPGALFDAIDSSDGSFLISPHRMQTLPLAKDFKVETLRQLYPPTYFLNIPNATVAYHDLSFETGSCCDNGRYYIEPCGGWWYSCNKWGLQDINPWLKFGPTGFTMPSITAHKGTCSYSSNTRLCGKPMNCNDRVPHRGPHGGPASKKSLCDEMPVLHVLGPKN